jgi:hypothetical protein
VVWRGDNNGLVVKVGALKVNARRHFVIVDLETRLEQVLVAVPGREQFALGEGCTSAQKKRNRYERFRVELHQVDRIPRRHKKEQDRKNTGGTGPSKLLGALRK